ncbi:MAG: nitroreductase family protein [Fusobacteriaceae bacterium]|jgi:putative NAD(P)H nitroreductase|nr:nitroreductase family protein [Fusobacteriaceae bacterium]MBN2837142.1 nitroreductase family protein [Fusobacteriaceae bacterium]
MSNFLEVVKERRSANKFIEGIKIPKEDFIEIFTDLTLAPSAFNLQHAHYYVAEDKNKINEIYEASYNQYKIKTSSATIIVTGDKNAYLDASKIYEGSKFLGIIDNSEYEFMINMIHDLYERWGEEFKHDEAIRNASLSAMQFMLLAKNKGWDTCPMIYFEKDKIKNILNIPENEVPVLMITMGKADKESFRVRGYRKAVSEFVNFI